MNDYLDHLHQIELEMTNPDPTERWVMWASLAAAVLGFMLGMLTR